MPLTTERARTLHARLGALLADAPSLNSGGPTDPNVLQWLGRAQIIVEESERSLDVAEFRTARQFLGTAMHDASRVFAPIYSVMAALENAFTPDATPTFLPASSPFDAFVAVSSVLQRAERDLLIVDRYLDATILTRYINGLQSNVSIRLMTALPRNRHTESLLEAAQRWNAQYQDQPVQIRVAPQHSIHDRLILVDGREAWSSTQSFKDIADRAPAELVNALGIAGEKIEAYEGLWSAADQIVDE